MALAHDEVAIHGHSDDLLDITFLELLLSCDDDELKELQKITLSILDSQ